MIAHVKLQLLCSLTWARLPCVYSPASLPYIDHKTVRHTPTTHCQHDTQAKLTRSNPSASGDQPQVDRRKLHLLTTISADTDASQSVVNQSAFHRIERKNESFVHGRPIERRDPDELPRFQPQKVKKALPKRKIKARPKPASKSSEAKEPGVEYWRPAGGDRFWSKEEAEASEPTWVVGLARVPGWELETFKQGDKGVIEQYGEVRDLVTKEVRDGVEDCVDVYAVFRSELVAEVVKDELDGSLVEGRKLRVRPASV